MYKFVIPWELLEVLLSKHMFSISDQGAASAGSRGEKNCKRQARKAKQNEKQHNFFDAKSTALARRQENSGIIAELFTPRKKLQFNC